MQMSTLREWHTALATAIQNGIPLSASLLEPYRAQASTNMRLVSVAASTASDRSAYEPLSNEFKNMAKLSDKYVNLHANLSYISPHALQNDDLNQRIRACGRSLGAMAGNLSVMVCVIECAWNSAWSREIEALLIAPGCDPCKS